VVRDSAQVGRCGNPGSTQRLLCFVACTQGARERGVNAACS
jgi:hypothetical protein